MNLFIIGSPWHAALANSIISKEKITDAIFFVECISDSSLKHINKVLKHPIQAIFYHDKTRFESIKKHGLLFFAREMPKEFKRIQKETEESCIKHKIKRILYFNFYSPITRKAINSAINKNNKIHLCRVEDGICDYFEFNFINHSKIQTAIKIIASTLLGRNKLYNRENSEILNLTDEYYCFFPEMVSSAWKEKRKTCLVDYRDEIRSNFAEPEEPDSRDNTTEGTLIIGQTLYEDGILTMPQEVSLYVNASAALRAPVFFKPHPRTSAEKLKKIKESGINLIESEKPAENLITNNKYYLIVGMWSNTIIYAQPIFGAKALTLNHHLLETTGSRNKHLSRIHQTLSTKFKDLYIDYRSHSA